MTRVNDGLGLAPLRNFARVTPGIYRSAQPEAGYEFEWLQRNGVNVVVDLRLESEQIDHLADEHGMTVCHLPVADDEAPTWKQACEFANTLYSARQVEDRILIHCKNGHGRTATFCALARIILNNWTAEQALQESVDRFGYEFKNEVQRQFIIDFAQAWQINVELKTNALGQALRQHG
jgi:protein-tyrosine phosphatase